MELILRLMYVFHYLQSIHSLILILSRTTSSLCSLSRTLPLRSCCDTTKATRKSCRRTLSFLAPMILSLVWHCFPFLPNRFSLLAFETMCSVLLKFPVDKDQKSLFGSYVARAIGKEGDGKLVAKRRPTEKDSRKYDICDDCMISETVFMS